MTEFCVFASAFVVSAFSGLAAYLRTGEAITRLGLFTAVLNSAMLGLGIALLWYTAYRDNPWFLVGVACLSGLGGVTSLNLVMKMFRDGGLNIKFWKDEK